jgi:hypothetical protein
MQKMLRMHHNNIIDKSIIVLLLLILTLSWSPILPGIYQIPNTYVYFPLVIITIVLMQLNKKFDLEIYLYSIIYIIIIYTISILLEDIKFGNKLLAVPLNLLIGYLIFKNINIGKDLIHKISNIAIFGLLMCLCGYIYALNNGNPLMEFKNPNGFENILYLTTFSNEKIGNIIRPNLIFDEAGSLSFFLCFIAFSRIILKMRSFKTDLIMLLGLITFSLMHLIIVVLYLLCLRKKFFIVLCLIILPIIYYNNTPESISFFIKRFEMTENGRFVGDNRSNQIDNFINIVNPKMLIFGAYECDNTPDFCAETNGDITSSPITPLYTTGIIGAVIQCLVNIFLLYCIYKNNNKFVSISMILVLLQRPYYSSIGYSTMIFIVCAFLYYKINDNNNNLYIKRRD